jgi:hypothetical protein
MTNFDNFYKKMIEEMSSPFSSYVNPGGILDDKWEEYKNSVEHFYNFKTRYGDFVEVKNVMLDRKIFFLFVNETLRGLIQYEPLQNNGVKIKETIKVGELGFYMSDVFKDFLLKVFSYILSDSYQTKEGFSVYKRLSNDKEVLFSILDLKTNNEISLNSSEELQNYYGIRKNNYLFKITLRK